MCREATSVDVSDSHWNLSSPRRRAVGVQFANRALARASHGFEQLAADPELKQAVGHKHVIGAADVVPPHADLLVADADDTIAGHPPADPLLSVAFRMSQLLPDLCPGRAEAALRREVA